MQRRTHVLLAVGAVVLLVIIVLVVVLATSGDDGGEEASPTVTAPTTTPTTTTTGADEPPADRADRPSPPPTTLPNKPERTDRPPAPPPSPDDPSRPPAPPAAPRGAPVAVVTGSRTLTVTADGRVSVPVRCRGRARCQGTVRLSVPRSQLDGVAGLDTTIASGPVAIARGGSSRVTLRLSKGAQRALVDGILRGTATAITRRSGDGTVTTERRRILRRG
jgi:hypothetical protein